jgi:hypothetical protein
MTNRARIAVVVAAVGFGFFGCHYAKTTPPPPPPPPQETGPTCASVATVTYDPANTTHPLQVSHKPITVMYPAQNAPQWAVCWYLVVQGNDPDPFDQMKLEGVGSLTGQRGQSVLLGDLNFRGKGFVKARFNDEPIWPAGASSSVTVHYSVIGRLKGATQDLNVDPDVVIQKSH